MISIDVNHLSKKFGIYDRPFDRLKEVFAVGRMKFHHEFWALRNISFAIPKGTTVGVLGQNGSGKSTLLKILAGVMLPTEGQVNVSGKRSSLIELGMGFHPEFSGRSNVYLSSALLGIPKEEIDARIDKIIEFSGIGDFIERPVKIYSTGMYVRLAFSVAISINPEILLIDEVLAVGDALFSQKCIQKLREFQQKGVTIFFVSHDVGAIRSLCNEVFLLDKGLLIEKGDPGDISDYYTALIQKRYADEIRQFAVIQSTGRNEREKRYRWGSFDAALYEIKVLNSLGEEIGALESGAECVIITKAVFFEDCENCVVGILVKDRLGNEIFGTNTGHHHQDTGPIEKDEILVTRFCLRMNLGPGDYSVTAAVHPDKNGFEGNFDWFDRAICLKVLPSEPKFVGVAKLAPKITSDRIKGKGVSVLNNPLNDLFPDAPDHIEISDKSQKFLLKGWHPPESWGDIHVRWTKNDPVFVMKVTGSKVKLEVGTSKPCVGSEPVNVGFFCNGGYLGSFALNAPGCKTVYFDLENGLKGQVARFRLSLNGTWRPHDYLGNGDTRDLGIYVKTIACE